jgi:hypothetical protein
VESWSPTIGDPTVMGWLTVVAYVVVAVLCVTAARRTASRGYAWVWWMLGAMSLVLAVNKQLDLQSWFTVVGKRTAIEQGWYESRRTVQAWFITGLAAAGALAGAALWLALGRARRRFAWALVGATFIVVFVVVRAASFHHMDIFLKSELWGVRPNWILELGGLAVLGFAAVRDTKAPAPNRSRARPREDMTWREILVELWRRAGRPAAKTGGRPPPRRTTGAPPPGPPQPPPQRPAQAESYRVVMAGPPRRDRR